MGDSLSYLDNLLSIPIAVPATLMFNLVFHYGLEKKTSHHDRMTDGAGFSIPSSEALLVERVERLNSFKDQWEGFQRDLSLTIFLCNPSVLREGISLGEIF